jgi:hypothetical protein
MAALIPSASATGSGTMTLAGPSTNSNQTVTIPDATGTMMVSGNMPAFSAYNNASQSISNNTLTKVLFQVEDFDTNSNFASSRFTPTIAGYYQINSGLNFPSSATGIAAVSIYKNGNEWQSGAQIPLNATYGIRPVVSTVIYFNGSTDYVEIYGLQISGGSISIGTNSTIATWFTGSMIRGA